MNYFISYLYYHVTIYYTYKITLLKGSFANHYYYGQHKTDNIEDSYAGSGTLVWRYYNKYGRIEGETYIKEIINYYNSLNELNTAEIELIGDKYNTDPMCLNLRAGGNSKGISLELRNHLSELNKGENNPMYGKSSGMKGKNPWNKGKILPHISDEHKKAISKKLKNRHLSEETRKKIGKSNSGENNPMYGKAPWNKGIKTGKHRVYDNPEHTKWHME